MRRPRSLRALTLSSNATIGPTTAQGPPSPTFTATTNVSHLDMRLGLPPGKVITRADLRASMAAYEELLNSSARYRSALTQMAKASAEFAKAIENTSRLKGGSDESCVGLQAAAGLHHLMANHWEVLGSSIVNQVEKPLHVELDTYKQVVHERSVAYEKSLQERSKIIRQTEMENMATGRKKQRDLNSFRAALNVLQSQVDELDRLKEAHYKEIIEHEEEVWTVVLGKVAVLVRSSLDVFDRLAAKQTDPMLEPMVQAHPDPFDSYGPPKPEDQIFSILPPLAIMSGSTGSLSARSATSPILTTPDLIPTSSSLPQSWADAAPSPFGSFSGSESWGGGGGGGGGGNDFKTPSSPTRERPSSPKSPGSATLTFRHARRSLPNTSVSPTTSTAMAQSSSSNISPPSSMRRSESKLRSVLASVDELPTTEVSNSALSTQHQQHRHHMRSEAASSSTVTSADSDRTALWSAEQAGYTFKEGPASEDEDNGVGGEGDRGTIRHALRPSSSQTTPRSSVFRIPVARPTSPLKNGVSDGEDPGPGPQSLPNM